jgi:hypothetical protein
MKQNVWLASLNYVSLEAQLSLILLCGKRTKSVNTPAVCFEGGTFALLPYHLQGRDLWSRSIVLRIDKDDLDALDLTLRRHKQGLKA